VNLCGVHLSLDDVQQGDVAVVVLPVSRGGHHHILGLHKGRKEGRKGITVQREIMKRLKRFYHEEQK
jgi:hypothetical protein